MNISTIYENICIMLFKYRNVDITEGYDKDVVVRNQKLLNNLSTNTYHVISGSYSKKSRHPGEKIAVYLFTQSIYTEKSPNFKKLIINALTKFSNIIIIATNQPSTHIANALILIRKDKLQVDKYIEYYTYEKFCMEIPTHTMVPQHEILDESERKKFEDKYHVSMSRMSVILPTDSMVVWLGARIGDVIKIVRLSETAGKEIAYRICKY